MSSTIHHHDETKPESNKSIVAIIRNSLWALSNLAQGSATSSLLFLQSSGNNGLTCCDLILMLQGQEESQPIPSDSMSSQPQNGIITWSEATWVCGALLCDAGHEQHPSTTMGCPKLVPALCNVIAPKQGTSKQATLE